MRREVLENAVERVLNDLTESGLAEMLAKGVEKVQRAPDKDEKEWIELAAITSYIHRVASYDQAEMQILITFGLDPLSNPDTWQSNLRGLDPAFIYTLHARVRSATSFLPSIIVMLRRDYTETAPESTGAEPEVHIQTVILSEEGGSLSSPQRLIELLTAIQGIYSLIAEVDGVPNASIAVVGMDSGSEKSFDFLGIARFMHELREALQAVYNIVAFHKQNVSIKNLQVAGETLSIVQKISKLEKSNAITNEEAQRMRHSLFSNLERFSATGAFTPEMNLPHQPPAVLMRSQPRLLAGPINDLIRSANDDVARGPDVGADASSNSDAIEDRGFTDEQIAAAIQLLSQGKADKPAKPRTPRKKRRPLPSGGGRNR